MSRAEVEQLWARDRVALVNCGMTLEAMLEFYNGLSRDLRAAAD